MFHTADPIGTRIAIVARRSGGEDDDAAPRDGLTQISGPGD